MNPKISVIIPCYNHGKYIKETVSSVLKQTFNSFEVIIVDDGSTDEEALRIFDEIEKKHSIIRVIHQKNGHLSNARNTGIGAARGEFFLPLDSDDTIEPTMIEKCYAEITKNPTLGFVYTYVRFFGDINFIWKNQEYNFYDLLHYNHPTVCGLVRKRAWESVSGYDENMKSGYEDWNFWISLGEKGWYGKLIKEPLFNYRKHGKSMINDARKKHDQIMDYIRSRHQKLYSEASQKRIKTQWKSRNVFVIMGNRITRELSTVKLKLALAGVSNKDEWQKYPLRTLWRCVPIRVKKGINYICRRKILNTDYFGKDL